jgi:fibronectin type 3 domain-containing protein
MEDRKWPAQVVPRRFDAALPNFYFLVSLFLSAAVLVLAACGSPTAPTPPSRRIPESVRDLTARQIGEEVRLSLTLPRWTTDGKPVGKNLRILLYRQFANEPPPSTASAPQVSAVEPGSMDRGQGLFRDARPVAEWEGAELERLVAGQRLEYADRISLEDLKAHAGEWAVYGVLASNRKGRSAGFSNLISLRIYPAPAPPQSVTARNVETGVELSWIPPMQTTSGTAIPSLGRFLIYRSTADGKEEWASVAEAANPPWIDTSIEYGKTYRYAMRALAQYGANTVAGDMSLAVSITPQDVFPPRTPEGLVAVPIPAAFGGPAIELSWQPNADTDLAGYNVYRSQQSGAGYRKLNVEPILGPAFSDRTAEVGKTYFYVVAAVDKAGNESKPSAEVSAVIPTE